MIERNDTLRHMDGITQAEQQYGWAELHAFRPHRNGGQRSKNLEPWNMKDNVIACPDGVVAVSFRVFCHFKKRRRVYFSTGNPLGRPIPEFYR
jgi:hypothetical protein